MFVDAARQRRRSGSRSSRWPTSCRTASIGTIVQVTPAPIQFTDHGSEIDVSAGQVALDVNKHITHDPTCGAMQWFHPLAHGRRRDDRRRRPAPLHRRRARHQVERPEQAFGVLRHLQLLGRNGGTGGKGRTGRQERRPSRPHPASPAYSAFPAHLDLVNKVALITGGKRIGARRRRASSPQRGVGRRAQLRAVAGRSREAAAERVRAAGRRAAILQADLSKPEACDALVQAAVAELRPSRHPDQHGVGLRAETLRRADASPTGTRPLDVDLRAAFLCAHAAAPHMRAPGRRPHHQLQRLDRAERTAALHGLSCRTTSRRRGVIALTEALALELAADNILVNAIAPGPILAPPETTDEEFKSRRRRDAARALGRRNGNRERRARAARQRLHHRRNHQDRWWATSEVRSQKSEVRRGSLQTSDLRKAVALIPVRP